MNLDRNERRLRKHYPENKIPIERKRRLDTSSEPEASIVPPDEETEGATNALEAPSPPPVMAKGSKDEHKR